MTVLATALTNALVDFLWQGVLMACLLWIALQLLRNHTSHTRYLASCAALITMIAMPAFSVWIGYRSATGMAAPTAPPLITNLIPASIPDAAVPWTSFLLPIWAAGVVIFSLRLLYGCTQVAILKRRGIGAQGPIIATVNALSKRMKLSFVSRVLVSTHADSPCVAGILRPVILLPLSAITGLTPPQLESILAHELAHIRRYDPLVNAIQALVETLLFYHPVVWWVSARIRTERELCCDDLALKTCGDALSYARALTALEKLRAPQFELVLPGNGAPLLYRIRRVLAPAGSETTPPKASGLLAMALAAACLAIIPVTRTHAQTAAPIKLSPGVHADTAGAVAAEPVHYPGPAIEKAIQGTVVAQLDVDAQGEVTDARVLSGPPELRKAVLQSVLAWRYQPEGRAATRQVTLDFQVPPREEMEGVHLTVDLLNKEIATAKARREAVQSAGDAQRIETLQAHIAALEQKLRLAETGAAQAGLDRQKALELKEKEAWRQRQLAIVHEQMQQTLQFRAMAGHVLSRIDFVGVSADQQAQLLSRLSAKVGDTISFQVLQEIPSKVRQFRDHVEYINCNFEEGGNNGIVLKIWVPGADQLADLNQAIRQVETQFVIMRQTHAERHPDILALQEKLEAMRRQRDALTK